MLMEILTHTPRWVFVLLLVLVAAGVRQMSTRSLALKRVAALPAAMMGLSFFGVVSVFSQQPVGLLGWALGLVAAAALVLSRPLPAGTHFDAGSQRFTVRGSVAPLALMMAIFFTKYIVAIALAIHPALAAQLGFAAGIGALYGVFSGVFLGRAARLWRLALPRHAVNEAVAR